jgi:hypothetical protein
MKVIIFSEDGSEKTFRAIQKIFKASLRLTSNSALSQLVEVLPRDDGKQAILSGNKWRSTASRDQREITELCRAIADEISKEKVFIVFHFDGDKAWSERTQSTIASEFDNKIERRVRAILVDKKTDEAEISRRLKHLIRMTPFYCIESWLYQNTAHSCSLLDKYFQGEKKDVCEKWSKNRPSIDEILMIWSFIPLGKRFNLDLSENGWPRDAAFASKTSFHNFVNSMSQNTEFMKQLPVSAAPASDAPN